MKKQILLLFILLLVPFMVNAETCNKNDIKIDSITVKDKSNNVQEKEETTINQNIINMNLDMKEVGDYIEYEVVVKNDSEEDYYLNNDSLVSESNYIEYSIKSKDNSNKIKAKSSKTFYVKAIYKPEVDNTAYQDGYFVDNNEFVLPISNSQNINPSTGVNIIFISICLLLLLISLSSLSKRSELILILTLLLIPTGVLAICKTDIVIDSTINIKKKNYNPCTFNGEMVPGAVYINGNFSYRYKEQRNFIESPDWISMEYDGWSATYNPNGIQALNEEYPFCSSINGKPIVSMIRTFEHADLNGFDLETLDTSNVKNMHSAFQNVKAENLDLRGLDTSNVETMEYMFFNAKINHLNVNNLNTSKVESMSYMFSQLETDSLDLSHFDTSHVTDFEGFFSNMITASRKLDVSHLDTHNATIMKSMFSGLDLEDLDVSHLDTSNTEDMGRMFNWLSLDSKHLDLSNFNTSKVTNMSSMFAYINVDTIDLSSFDTSKVTNMDYLFEAANVKSLDLSSFNTSNVITMNNMFYDTENLETINLSTFDMSNVQYMYFMFSYTNATTGYARTQADADILNAVNGKPATLTFVVK